MMREGMADKMTRRGFFDRVSDGIYGTALATLLSGDVYGSLRPLMAAASDLPDGHRRTYDLKPRAPHFPPKAKSIIHLSMNGGPSQMDLFDPKPALERHHGESYFDKVAADLTTPEQSGGLMKSPFKFAQYGKSGAWVSEAMPHLTNVVDELAFIRSMQTMHPNH